MNSISIDYVFNRIYDVLLWIKYVWLFVLLRKNPDEYLAQHAEREFDGLRERGWFDAYLAKKDAAVPEADVHVSLWQKVMEAFGVKPLDTDGDGIPNIDDASPYDPSNLSSAELKERYEVDYTFSDHLRDAFGIGPKDTDKDGVPDSYELTHSMNPNNADTDTDGLLDGDELVRETNPVNNDSDSDLVIDGRDERPLDPSVSSTSLDTDGDGVSDSVEGYLGTDIHSKDTDADAIFDNMDAFSLDPVNSGQVQSVDLSGSTEGLHLSIQSPVLSLATDIVSILAIAIVVFFVYVSFRWIILFWEGLNHFDHHFKHDDHGHGGKDDLHVIKGDDMPAGIANLPIHEDAPALPPSPADFEDHPRFAIIQGYMSSTSEALWRIGLLEADNMLAEVLRDKGYQGETVADMLKEASFKTVQLAWDAHGVRNRIAHEGSDFELTEREAKRAFTLYESVFRELKAIR